MTSSTGVSREGLSHNGEVVVDVSVQLPRLYTGLDKKKRGNHGYEPRIFTSKIKIRFIIHSTFSFKFPSDIPFYFLKGDIRKIELR